MYRCFLVEVLHLKWAVAKSTRVDAVVHLSSVVLLNPGNLEMGTKSCVVSRAVHMLESCLTTHADTLCLVFLVLMAALVQRMYMYHSRFLSAARHAEPIPLVEAKSIVCSWVFVGICVLMGKGFHNAPTVPIQLLTGMRNLISCKRSTRLPDVSSSSLSHGKYASVGVLVQN